MSFLLCKVPKLQIVKNKSELPYILILATMYQTQELSRLSKLLSIFPFYIIQSKLCYLVLSFVCEQTSAMTRG